jgi:microcystin-dependent protein
MPISQNTALFSLLGTIYGGDGRSTFALPNLQGRSPIAPGQGPGLSQRFLGESGGSDAVTLTSAQVPSHGHGLRATGSATTGNPAGASLANVANSASAYRIPGAATTFLAADVMSSVGGAAHNNRQPYLGLYFAIALQGIYPSRS